MRFSDVAHVRATQKDDTLPIPFNGVYFYNSSAVVPNGSSSLQFQKFSWYLVTLRLIVVLHEEKPHFCFNNTIYMKYIHSFWAQLCSSEQEFLVFTEINICLLFYINTNLAHTWLCLFSKKQLESRQYHYALLFKLHISPPTLSLLYRSIHTIALRLAVKVY